MRQFWDKYIHYNIPFYILTGIAIALLIVSFVIPPTGEIHPSVLQGVGEIFGFAALWSVLVAVESGGTAKFSKGNVNVEIKNENQEENQ